MSILSAVELFKGLSEEELATIESHCVKRTFPKNTVLISENDPADSLYVIESGRVKVYLSDDNGKEYIVNIQTGGEYFGELALLDDSKRSASVMAMESSTFYILYKKDFVELLEKFPGMAITLLHNTARRVRHLTERVRSLALQDVYGRVRNVLLDLSETGNDGVMQIPERLTQQDIADRVGASREMVARILKDLTIGGYLSIENRQITIHKLLPEKY